MPKGRLEIRSLLPIDPFSFQTCTAWNNHRSLFHTLPILATSSTVAMEQHALAILELNDLWNWHDTKSSGKQGDKFQVAAPKLLYFLIVESQRLGGEVLDHFWKQLATCHEKLNENSQSKSLITQSYRLAFICHSRTSERGGFRVGAEVFRGLVSGIRSQKRPFEACVRHGSGVLYSSWCRM